MGNCFRTCASIGSVVLYGTQKPNTYSIILKTPHGTAGFYQSQRDPTWTHCDDVNVLLKREFETPFHHWIVYNDETPTMTSSSGAHAKGILAWNETTIKWIIHSIPKFPQTFDGTASFPDICSGELQYGQSIICLTFGIEHLHQIQRQLFIMHPYVYIANVDYTAYTNLYKTVQNSTYQINDAVHHVAKSPHCHKELYTEIVIPQFGGHCLTETWVRGHECVDTENCKMAEKIVFETFGIDYTYTHDHSKYCYSDKGWVMVGDMNRMTSQIKRGGGGVVIRDVGTASMFKSIMV